MTDREKINWAIAKLQAAGDIALVAGCELAKIPAVDALDIADLLESKCGTNKRFLDLDALVDELEYIMAKTEPAQDSDPDAYFRYGSARTMKVWLLRSWGEQTGTGFHGRWIKRHDGKTICSVCWMPKDISELNGCCVGCGAAMDGGSVCT